MHETVIKKINFNCHLFVESQSISANNLLLMVKSLKSKGGSGNREMIIANSALALFVITSIKSNLFFQLILTDWYNFIRQSL